MAISSGRVGVARRLENVSGKNIPPIDGVHVHSLGGMLLLISLLNSDDISVSPKSILK